MSLYLMFYLLLQEQIILSAKKCIYIIYISKKLLKEEFGKYRTILKTFLQNLYITLDE